MVEVVIDAFTYVIEETNAHKYIHDLTPVSVHGVKVLLVE